MDKDLKVLIKETIEQFIRLLNIYNEIQVVPMQHGSGYLLYPAEISTIEAIGRNRGINVTELAKKLGITKGAVSQMISKLVKKGLVRKIKDTYNQKEVLLELSDEGKTAFEEKARYRQEMRLDFLNFLDDVSLEDCLNFKAILGKAEAHMSQYLKDR